MKINSINSINFGNRVETGQTDKVKYSKEYSDNNVLLKYIEKDKITDQFLKVENFDNNGKRIDIQEFEYSPNKIVEHYKNNSQEYTRTISKEIKDSFEHIKEVFVSKTTPANNYVNESVKDVQGKLVKLFSNGKRIL